MKEYSFIITGKILVPDDFSPIQCDNGIGGFQYANQIKNVPELDGFFNGNDKIVSFITMTNNKHLIGVHSNFPNDIKIKSESVCIKEQDNE